MAVRCCCTRSYACHCRSRPPGKSVQRRDRDSFGWGTNFLYIVGSSVRSRQRPPLRAAEEVHPMISASRSYDVVILGSGIAGLAGALAAHALGLQPVVLEKAATLGGGPVHSYGLIWVGQNHLAQAAGHRDTPDEVLAYMRFLGGGNVDAAKRLCASTDPGSSANARSNRAITSAQLARVRGLA